MHSRSQATCSLRGFEAKRFTFGFFAADAIAAIQEVLDDVIVFRLPPPAVRRAIFGAVAPIAHWRGYRATYPQISRTVLAPRGRKAASA